MNVRRFIWGAAELNMCRAKKCAANNIATGRPLVANQRDVKSGGNPAKARTEPAIKIWKLCGNGVR
jgi:hypothetical protein